uniref:Uncharacterized protein n=1 Tax=Tanacetum cinerariifolium TaxID=118510 RepID=A0A6L2J7G7_TANCI|nr:hypothetical protein CTI12_AA091940 [Tanacetum cinerariifolium]
MPILKQRWRKLKRLMKKHDYLIQRYPNSWCKAFFGVDIKCLTFKNGISESHHKAIIVQRSKPIITMLEDIRIYLMQREISGIPCVHDVAGYMHLKRDPDVGVSQWFRRRRTCTKCLEVGHNKSTYDKDLVPKTLKPRKTPCRKKEPESVSYASFRGRNRGSRGRGGRRDEIDVNVINKTPTSNNLNVNTHESRAVHMAEDVVEVAVADPFVEDEIIDNVVVVDDGVLVSSSSQKSKGKKKAKELALPFKIFHKNKGTSQRIQKIQAKKFNIDDQVSHPDYGENIRHDGGLTVITQGVNIEKTSMH